MEDNRLEAMDNNTGGLGVVGSNPAAPTKRTVSVQEVAEAVHAAQERQNGTKAPQNANSGARSPAKSPARLPRIGWREQLAFVKHEIAESGGIHGSHSRQQGRALLRRMAKVTAADLNGKRRKASHRPNKADNEFRVTYPKYEHPLYGGAAIRAANARNGVGRPPRAAH